MTTWFMYKEPACGTWLINQNVFITVHCFVNNENDAISMATDVTARDVRVTERNALKSIREGKCSCLHLNSSAWICAGITCLFTRP